MEMFLIFSGFIGLSVGLSLGFIAGMIAGR